MHVLVALTVKCAALDNFISGKRGKFSGQRMVFEFFDQNFSHSADARLIIGISDVDNFPAPLLEHEPPCLLRKIERRV